MADLIVDNDIQLPPEILAEMPSGLTRIDQFKWRRNKANELKAKATLSNQGSSQTVASDVNKAEKSETNDKSVSETPADDDLSNNEISTETEEKVSDKPVAVKKAKVGLVKSAASNKTTSSEYKYVRSVHESVLAALHRLFPGGSSNGDLIAAAVYILTDGDCEVSETAMQLVKSYNRRDNDDLAERLSNIEHMLRDGTRMWQSIELCTCYNTFDRRYGSKERRVSPKETEFREQGNLDMLDRLRRQADDQRKVDSIERGRDIYNSIKDKNDK